MDNATMLTILVAAATPLLAFMGSWVAVKISIAKLQVKTETLEETVDKHDKQLIRLNDDSLVHDMEIETAFTALKLQRVSRQRIRD